MTTIAQRITPFLWFDNQAEAAANFYVSIFPNSTITNVVRYGAGAAAVGRAAGSVMTVAFALDGQKFVGINGGPHFTFTPAISFVVNCTTQGEVDQYWDELSAEGDPTAQQCGWLKDKFGVSWQIVPEILPQLLSDPDPQKAARATQAMLQMKKLDIAKLIQAQAG